MRLPKLDLVEIGKELAHADDDEQSCLFNAFAQELLVCCRHKSETQICYLSDKLDRNAHEVFMSIAEFIKLRKERKP